MNPMLNLCEGHVFVELNYPHINGISGYELHHDVASLARGSPPRNQSRTDRKTCTNRAKTRRSVLGANNGEAREGHQGRGGLRRAPPRAQKPGPPPKGPPRGLFGNPPSV